MNSASCRLRHGGAGKCSLGYVELDDLYNGRIQWSCAVYDWSQEAIERFFNLKELAKSTLGDDVDMLIMVAGIGYCFSGIARRRVCTGACRRVSHCAESLKMVD